MSYPTTPLPRGPILIPGCCTDMPQTYFSLSLFTYIISSCAPLSPALSPFFFSHYHCYFIPPILRSLAPPPCLVLFSIFPSFFIPPQPSASVKLRISTYKQMLLGEWRPRLGSRLTSIPSLAVVFTPLFCCPNLFHVHKLLLILYLCVPCHVFGVYLPHSLCFFLSR